MAKRKPLPKYNTPVGIARYPHLTKADTRFDDDGVYKCDIILPGDDEDVIELIGYLEGIRDERFEAEETKKGVKKIAMAVYEDELDDAGDETGNIILKTKLNAIGRNKAKGEEWTNEPKLFDSQGNPLPDGVNPWSGTKLIVAGTVNSYAMTSESINEKTGKTKKYVKVGVSLKCKGVQILDLVTGGDATAESFGFGKEEGGYETDVAKAGLAPSSDGAEDTDETEDDEDEF